MGQSGMSGLEGLLSQLSSGSGGSAAGGLDGLLGTLRQAGLGEQVDSWINTGENRPVEPEALTQAFGAERLQGAAQGLGLQGGGALAGILAQLLPVLIDRLTPQGQMPSAPQEDAGGGWGSILGGLLGGGQGGGFPGGGAQGGGGLGSILGGLLGGAGGAQGGGGGLGDILGGLLGGAGAGGQPPQAAPQEPGPAPTRTGGGDDPFSSILPGGR